LFIEKCVRFVEERAVGHWVHRVAVAVGLRRSGWRASFLTSFAFDLFKKNLI
jgi:hypothetical protein